MSFDYFAYAMPENMIEILREKPEAFLNIFYESNYAEAFEDIKEECPEDVALVGEDNAEKLYEYVQYLLENEDEVLDLDGEYWAMPTHFFLTAEYDENDRLPQPSFAVKREQQYLLVNALACTNLIDIEDGLVLFTPSERVAEIAKALPEILEDDFKKRWQELSTKTGHFADVFTETQDLDDFITDLREFMHEVLIPFYQNLAKKKMGMIAILD
jgi:uncharacterized protein YdcH (DUF465 family)